LANAVVEHDFEGDGFWMAEEVDMTPMLTIGADPDLCIGNPDDLEEGPQDLELNFTWDGPDDWLHEEDGEVEGEEMAGAVITPCNDHNTPHVELYDSGATRHISPYKNDFTAYSLLSPPMFLNTTNQQRFLAVGTGKLAIHVPNGRGETELILNNTLHAPSIGYTLVSLGALDEEGYKAHIGGGYLELIFPHGEHVGHVTRTYKCLYKVSHPKDSANTVEILTIMELHRRLGHIATSSACKLVESGAITGVKLDPSSQEAACDACIFAHTTWQPVPKVQISPPAQNFSNEVHTDVWGPSSTPTRQGRKYFVTFTDDATRYTVTFLMHTKDEALEAYKSFEAWALMQQHCKGIKTLRSDHGGEYLSKAFNQHLAAAGTVHQLTTHDTPQLNGVMECLNRTLLECIRAFMHTSGLPKTLWGEGLRHATWLKNQTATRALDGKTPYEVLFSALPDLLELKLWGCPIWVHDATGAKLDI
jgi:transposase InsO family protein